MAANDYTVTAPTSIEGVEPGKLLEGREFTVQEEDEYLDRGWLQIVPREYKVIGPLEVHDTKPGKTFTRALRLREETALVEAGQIERVEKPKTTRSK